MKTLLKISALAAIAFTLLMVVMIQIKLIPPSEAVTSAIHMWLPAIAFTILTQLMELRDACFTPPDKTRIQSFQK